MFRQLQVNVHTCMRLIMSCRLGCRVCIICIFYSVHKPAFAADECFCNSTLLYARGTGKMTALTEAVQLNGVGQQQAVELRHASHAEARTQVNNFMDANSSSTELAEWGAVAKSLNKGCFVEQEMAF